MTKQSEKAKLVLAHDAIGGTSGMGRVVAAMARIARDAGWDVTLVGVDVDGTFDWARRIPVAYMHRLPSVPAGLAWVAAAGRRLRNENLSDAVVHVHAPLMMHFADIFTCHHLAEGAARHGLREPVRNIEGLARRTQEIINVKIDSLSYQWRPSRTRVTFVSEFLRDEFRDLYGEPNGGEIVAPPAPEWRPITTGERRDARRRYKIAGDEVTVGYFGGSDPRKGVERVLDLGRDSRYIVLAAGPKSDRLRFGTRNGLGYVNVRDVLAACDVVVAPAIFDAAPVAVLEAVAAGLPVVTGANSGWAEPLLRFGAGTACTPDTPLSASVESVVPGSVTAAKAFTEHYSYAALTERLTALWTSVRESKMNNPAGVSSGR